MGRRSCTDFRYFCIYQSRLYRNSDLNVYVILEHSGTWAKKPFGSSSSAYNTADGTVLLLFLSFTLLVKPLSDEVAIKWNSLVDPNNEM